MEKPGKKPYSDERVLYQRVCIVGWPLDREIEFRRISGRISGGFGGGIFKAKLLDFCLIFLNKTTR